MRVPIRKPGKYTHLKPDPNLTEDKFNEFKNKLERLKAARPAAIKEVKRLAEMGDFSENAAYQIAKGHLRGINDRISDLQERLKKARIIETTGGKDRVGLGSKVTIEISGQRKTYLILGSAETDPNQGVISHNSPLGAALIGKKVFDLIEIKLGNKEVECKIVKIE